MKLTPLALQNAEVLRALAQGQTRPETLAALAAGLGRDKSNLAKTMKALVEADLIDLATIAAELTAAGRAALEALDRAEGKTSTAPAADAAAVPLELHLIDPDPELNPRTHFDEEALDSLAASIGDQGVLQPILVRPSAEPGRYTVVMGERRRRAAVKAGLFTIPAVIRELADAEAFEAATIENVQREDMNPLEEARAFQRIIADRQAADPSLKLKDAKEIVADRVRKTVRFVELRLQLLTLPEVKQVEVARGVTSPKEAILWQRQHKPPEPIKLAPRDLFLLAEIACHSFGRDNPPKAARTVRVDGAVRDDGRLEPLKAKRLVNQYKDWSSGEDTISVTEPAILLLGEQLVGFATNPRRALAELRASVLTDDEKAESTGEFFTPWLNPPFALHPSEIARKEREAQAVEARRRRDAEEARVRRDRGREGRAKLAKVLEFEALAPGLSDDEFASAFAEALGALGFTGPFETRVRGEGLHAEPIVTDANGEGLAGAAGALEALRRLYTIALNRACGFAAMSGPELDTPWAQEADDEDEEDEPLPFADPAEIEDEDDTQIAPGDDEESPAFLRRLAGAAPAEAH